MKTWYDALNQFLEVNDVEDPAKIWNVPNLAKFSHWLEQDHAASDRKEQITTLCAISAVGDVIPPMHIFSGQRFWYNPLKGGGYQWSLLWQI